MRILFVADGRSPISLNWLHYWLEHGHQVYLASTFACTPELPLAGLRNVPVAFSQAKAAGRPASVKKGELWGARSLGLRTVIRQLLGPLTIARAAPALRRFVEETKPDLVHALRIPYEGMLAAEALAAARVPLLISVWGNDFTLHAPASPLMRHYTNLALSVADALHADCQRDIRLARAWGFAPHKPTLVTPGNGGIRADLFYPPAAPQTEPLVVNPRGFRAYVRNDTFFKAIPLVLAQRPDARFVCAAMAAEPQAQKWTRQLGIESAVELLAPLPHPQMADLFRRASLVVSPAIHDGTPNSLLEALACGCFPIAGDLESIREWITPEVNGLLVDPGDPAALAAAILRGLNDPLLRQRAAQANAKIIAEQAEYNANMQKALQFYEAITRAQDSLAA
ncbi:MAG: glycosyltransferase family 4 protein [Anaerolineales bacterium]|jgi:glycosyltransferase involved in cell wall biosynthesis|nr:glycosyltransferase family 4 protein [Anaerolineales bacterium]